MKRKIDQKPVFYRVLPVYRKDVTVDDEHALRVEREDGEAGVVYNVPIATYGDVKGHSEWMDKAALESIVRFGNARKQGIKNRLAHPNECSDGVGTTFARTKNFRLVDDRVVMADVHLLKSGAKLPVGDVNEWFLEAASEAPDSFGVSLVGDRDPEAYKQFINANSVIQGDKTVFLSPDKDNKRNYPHLRLSTLDACDMVDDPAANPSGLVAALSSTDGRFIETVTETLNYLFGLQDGCPDPLILGSNPDRAKQFLNTWLTNNGVKLTSSVHDTEQTESDSTTKGKEPTMPTRDELIKMLSGEHGIDVIALQKGGTLAGAKAVLKADHNIDIDSLQTNSDSLQDVCKLLSLSATSDKTAIVTAITNLQTQAAKAGQIEEQLALSTATSRVKDLIKEGKILPAAEATWISLAKGKTDQEWASITAGLNPVIAPGQQKSKTGNGEVPPTTEPNAADVYELSNGEKVEKAQYNKEALKTLVKKNRASGSGGMAALSVPATK